MYLIQYIFVAVIFVQRYRVNSGGSNCYAICYTGCTLARLNILGYISRIQCCGTPGVFQGKGGKIICGTRSQQCHAAGSCRRKRSLRISYIQHRLRFIVIDRKISLQYRCAFFPFKIIRQFDCFKVAYSTTKLVGTVDNQRVSGYKISRRFGSVISITALQIVIVGRSCYILDLNCIAGSVLR